MSKHKAAHKRHSQTIQGFPYEGKWTRKILSEFMLASQEVAFRLLAPDASRYAVKKNALFLAKVLREKCYWEILIKEGKDERFPRKTELYFILSSRDQRLRSIIEKSRTSIYRGSQQIVLPLDNKNRRYVILENGARITFPVSATLIKNLVADKNAPKKKGRLEPLLSEPLWTTADSLPEEERSRDFWVTMNASFDPREIVKNFPRRDIALVPRACYEQGSTYSGVDDPTSFGRSCIEKIVSALPCGQRNAARIFLHDHYNSHHLHPKFFGGKNGPLIFIQKALHQALHEDFDHTLNLVRGKLQKWNAPSLEDHWALCGFLSRHIATPCRRELLEIPNVSIQDNIIYASILWPEGEICIPQKILAPKKQGAVQPIAKTQQQKIPAEALAL